VVRKGSALEQGEGTVTRGWANPDLAFLLFHSPSVHSVFSVVNSWPLSPSSLQAGEDAHGFGEANATEVVEQMERGGGDEDERVEAVEEAAVPGDEGGEVFDADVALDRGEHEVAELAADADDQAQGEEVEGSVDQATLE